MNLPYLDFHCHKKISQEQKRDILPIYSIDAFSNYGVVELDPNDYFSLGIHPWNLNQKTPADLLNTLIDELSEKAKNVNCLFIGEVGLDAQAAPCSDDFKMQQWCLKKHFEIATVLNKGVVLHSVKSTNEIIKTIKEVRFKNQIFFHDFNGSESEINQLLKINASFSLGRNLFRSNSKITKTIRQIPLENVFLESDEGNFSIFETYKKAGQLLNIDEQRLKEKIIENFKNLKLF